MTDVKIPQSRTTKANRNYGRGLLVAAIVAAVVVAAGLLLLDRSGETELAAAADAPVDLAYQIVEARNAFDAQALAELLGSAEYVGHVGQDDLTGYVQWLEAFDWRIADPTCEQATDVLVACSYTLSNRLTRHAALEGEVDGTLSLNFESGALTLVSDEVVLSTSGYSSRAFSPFFDWVNQNHREAVEVMWDRSFGIAPRFTEESIRLFDDMLTEYTGTG